MPVTHDFTICPRCKSNLQRSVAFDGTYSEFFYECPNCNTYVNTYTPLPHQTAVHTDSHLYIGNFGGYGVGKTYTSREEIIKHILLTPGGLILIGAKVTSQYEQTIKKELEGDIPAAFVKSYSAQKSTMTFINGCRIVYRPLEDPDTLRSYNVTMFVILEASEVKYEAFSQLQTRLRNRAAGVPELDPFGAQKYKTITDEKTGAKKRIPVYRADWRKGIIESNPDSGWIRTNFVMESDNVNFYGNVLDKSVALDSAEKHPNKSSHVAATDVNVYLPSNFYNDVSVGKPVWWINKFLHGSFAYSEGLVYPRARVIAVDPFDIPKEWKRIVAHDYGLVDPSVFVCAAIDKQSNRVYIYRDSRSTNINIEQLSQLYYEATSDIPAGGMYCTPIIDPKTGPRRDYNKKSLIDLYLERGILFEPGHVSVDTRIFRLNTYIEQGNLFIFKDCTELLWEFSNYKFPDRTLESNRRDSDKPVDKNNHGVNCVEWIVMRLPGDPRDIQNLGAYDSSGRRLDGTGHYDPFSSGSAVVSELAYEMEDYTSWI